MKLEGNRSTAIEWCEHTWTPFVGCKVITAGCTNCYAMRSAWRLQEFGVDAYKGTVRMVNANPVWTGKLNRASDATWRKPFRIKTPSLIFVMSMSDFYYDQVPDLWRLEAHAVMRATRHQYQVLTKRPEAVVPFLERTGSTLPQNAWIGATVERADVVHRIDTLRSVPARIRFLSVEPLIGPVGRIDLTGIHWVIVGGESGPGARPMHIDWLREVVSQARAQGVATFLKQYGHARNNPLWKESPDPARAAEWVKRHDPIGKGGSLLDGFAIKEYPKWNR
jgi:protein gp37